jgi:hypothetical protein
MHLNMEEALGSGHTRGKGLLRVRWWPVGSKLVFDHMAAPVPEIMDGSLYSPLSFPNIQMTAFQPLSYENCTFFPYIGLLGYETKL